MICAVYKYCNITLHYITSHKYTSSHKLSPCCQVQLSDLSPIPGNHHTFTRFKLHSLSHSLVLRLAMSMILASIACLFMKSMSGPRASNILSHFTLKPHRTFKLSFCTTRSGVFVPSVRSIASSAFHTFANAYTV